MSEDCHQLQHPLDDPSLQPLLCLLESAPEECHGIRQRVHEIGDVAERRPDLGLSDVRKLLEFLTNAVYQRVIDDHRRRTGRRLRGDELPENKLYQRICWLIDGGHFPAHLEPDATAVREAGNEGTHEYDKQVAAVTTALLHLMPILRWYFGSVPRAVSSLQFGEREPVPGGAGSPWVIKIDIPGDLRAKPANESWDDCRIVGETPGQWTLRGGEVAHLNVDRDVSEIALGSLVGLRYLPGFQSLNLSHCRGVTNASLGYLRGLMGLRSLEICNTPVTDEGLAPLGGLRELHSLDLSSCREVKGPGLEHLWNCQKLRSLDLENTRVICEALVFLRGLINLQSLRIGHDDNMADLIATDYYRLWRAQPSDFCEGRLGFKYLRGLASLQELSLSTSWRFPEEIAPDDLAHLAGIVNLRSLDLVRINAYRAGWMDHLPSLPNLRAFKAPGFSKLPLESEARERYQLRFDSPSLACLRGMPNLVELDLRHSNWIPAESLIYVGELHNLRALYLNDSQWPLPFSLERLVNLQSLQLGYFYYGIETDIDEHLTDLPKLPNLQRLELEHTRVSDKGLPSLRGLSKLEYLGLNSTLVTDVGLAHLREFTGLRFVDLWGCRVTADGLRCLRAALPKCRFMTGSVATGEEEICGGDG
ncbi:MAG TPA: hypothetical protein VN688_14755 [Gemmataceae bacterium]|nr:hypothetical protein [Gemmataceae bacterium]